MYIRIDLLEKGVFESFMSFRRSVETKLISKNTFSQVVMSNFENIETSVPKIVKLESDSSTSTYVWCILTHVVLSVHFENVEEIDVS